MPYYFFFNDTATTEIYTLSLHDALPIWCGTVHRLEDCCVLPYVRPRRDAQAPGEPRAQVGEDVAVEVRADQEDRKSTRLNSSHANISYAVFCLKKKKKNSKT